MRYFSKYAQLFVIHVLLTGVCFASPLLTQYSLDNVYLGMPQSEFISQNQQVVFDTMSSPKDKNHEVYIERRLIGDTPCFIKYYVKNKTVNAILMSFLGDANILESIKNEVSLLVSNNYSMLESKRIGRLGKQLEKQDISVECWSSKNESLFLIAHESELSVWIYNPKVFKYESFFTAPSELDKYDNAIKGMRSKANKYKDDKSKE